MAFFRPYVCHNKCWQLGGGSFSRGLYIGVVKLVVASESCRSHHGVKVNNIVTEVPIGNPATLSKVSVSRNEGRVDSTHHAECDFEI